MDLHLQKNLVVNNKQLDYQGIFRLNELVNIVNQALTEKGYTKREKKTEEIVTEAGRKTYFELRPFKDITEHETLMLKIKITLNQVTEVEEKVNGIPSKFQKGAINITFDSWLLMDYQKRWRMNPVFYFLKGIFNKYFYNTSMSGTLKGELTSDTAYVYSQIRQLLNSYKVETGKIKTEEEVKEEMAIDIGSHD
jgi:hypothetical protein